MFSLGVVLYEMLAGKRRFTGARSGQVLHTLVSVDPEPLSKVRPDLPGALGEIVKRALQKTPGDRYDNWAEFALQGRLLNVLATGEWFGEQPFIHGHPVPRQATVETTVDSVLVEFPREKLEALSERCHRRFVKALLRTLADRLALSNIRISRMA